jgi:hypothetical protein
MAAPQLPLKKIGVQQQQQKGAVSTKSPQQIKGAQQNLTPMKGKGAQLQKPAGPAAKNDGKMQDTNIKQVPNPGKGVKNLPNQQQKANLPKNQKQIYKKVEEKPTLRQSMSPQFKPVKQSITQQNNGKSLQMSQQKPKPIMIKTQPIGRTQKRYSVKQIKKMINQKRERPILGCLNFLQERISQAEINAIDWVKELPTKKMINSRLQDVLTSEKIMGITSQPPARHSKNSLIRTRDYEVVEVPRRTSQNSRKSNISGRISERQSNISGRISENGNKIPETRSRKIQIPPVMYKGNQQIFAYCPVKQKAERVPRKFEGPMPLLEIKATKKELRMIEWAFVPIFGSVLRKPERPSSPVFGPINKIEQPLTDAEMRMLGWTILPDNNISNMKKTKKDNKKAPIQQLQQQPMKQQKAPIQQLQQQPMKQQKAPIQQLQQQPMKQQKAPIQQQQQPMKQQKAPIQQQQQPMKQQKAPIQQQQQPMKQQKGQKTQQKQVQKGIQPIVVRKQERPPQRPQKKVVDIMTNSEIAALEWVDLLPTRQKMPSNPVMKGQSRNYGANVRSAIPADFSTMKQNQSRSSSYKGSQQPTAPTSYYNKFTKYDRNATDGNPNPGSSTSLYTQKESKEEQDLDESMLNQNNGSKKNKFIPSYRTGASRGKQRR